MDPVGDVPGRHLVHGPARQQRSEDLARHGPCSWLTPLTAPLRLTATLLWRSLLQLPLLGCNLLGEVRQEPRVPSRGLQARLRHALEDQPGVADSVPEFRNHLLPALVARQFQLQRKSSASSTRPVRASGTGRGR